MCTAPPSSFSFAEMLSEDFDTSKIFDDTLGTTGYLMSDPFLPPVTQHLGNYYLFSCYIYLRIIINI